jgi:glycerate 2-kinase
MLCAPAEGITLEDKARAGRMLMHAGADIHDLNCVRKHLSDIKGGRLGAAAGSSLTLAISDVHHPIEDDPSTIGSGPTAGDPTTFTDALVIARGAGDLPPAVLDRLRAGAAGDVEETIKPGDPRLARARLVVIGNRRTALAAAAACAEALGYGVAVISEPTRGEANVAARTFLARAGECLRGASGPVCVLAAGETTVKVAGRGRGGRNQQFALAAAPDLSTLRAMAVASAGTDGIDGLTPAAGAIVDSATCQRAIRAGLDRERALAENDAYPFFEQLGDLIVSGPTGTNVGDIQILLTQ